MGNISVTRTQGSTGNFYIKNHISMTPSPPLEIIFFQGWEFAHLISEGVARFLSKMSE